MVGGSNPPLSATFNYQISTFNLSLSSFSSDSINFFRSSGDKRADSSNISMETSVKGLKYENYNIEIATGTYTRAVILSNGKPTIELNLSLKNFVNEFERYFEDDLKSFLGNISKFKTTKNIFHKIFDLP